MKRVCAAAAVLSVAAVAVPFDAGAAGKPPTWKAAKSSAVLDRQTITQEAASASWDTCADTEPGDTCEITSISVLRTTWTSPERRVDESLVADRSTFTVADDGALVLVDRSYGTGPVTFTLDKKLRSATADAVVEVVDCGVEFSTACDDDSYPVSIRWTATGDLETQRARQRGYHGNDVYRGRGTDHRRTAVAAGVAGDRQLGRSSQAEVELSSGSSIHFVRGHADRLGHIEFPLWHVVEAGSGPQASAEWNGCPEGAGPAGSRCRWAQVIAYGFEGTDITRLSLRMRELEFGADGEVVWGSDLSYHVPATLNLDLGTGAATVEADIDVLECTDAPPGPDAPPPGPPPPDAPPGDPGPPQVCDTVPTPVSVSWTASGRSVRMGSSRTIQGHSTSTSAYEWQPATATGSVGEVQLGASTWALFGNRDEQVTYRHPTQVYLPTWAAAPDGSGRHAAAEFDTCSHTIRDGVFITEPDVGDICTSTLLEVHEAAPGAGPAELWVQQSTFEYGQWDGPHEPRLTGWWHGTAALDLTGDRRLDAASATGPVEVTGCGRFPDGTEPPWGSPPASGELDQRCWSGTVNLQAQWTGVGERDNVPPRQYRLADATLMVDGEPLPSGSSRWGILSRPRR